MKRRFTVDEKGRLIDREGQVCGRISNLTLEIDSPEPGGEGGCSSSLTTATELSANAQETLLPQGGSGDSQKPPDDVATVWAHYQAVIPSGSRYTLESKRRTIIRNALKVRPLATVLLAVDGLAASSYHNGENRRRKKYLGINYALQGIGPQSNDERIDEMASKAKATVSDFVDTLPSSGREMVRDRMRKVEQSLLHPDDKNLVSRAGDSASYLLNTFGLSATVVEGRVKWARNAAK